MSKLINDNNEDETVNENSLTDIKLNLSNISLTSMNSSKDYSYNLINDKKNRKIEETIQKDEPTVLKLSNPVKPPKLADDNSGDAQVEIPKMWLTLKDEIKNNKNYYYNKNSKLENNKFKVIRVFVSSTFTDFYNEREELVKNVFVEFEEWCRMIGYAFIQCDLRWGVPKDSTSNETILTCMNEIDRCYNENNGQPFFIGMLGEKYGWVPKISELSNEIVETYKWIDKVSITFMEFLHGALRSNNKNACFMIRLKDSLNGVPSSYDSKFYEKDEYSKKQLEVNLKLNLINQYF
jgi:hypothetical protein